MKAFCCYCLREMEPGEFRAFNKPGMDHNDVICPQCFKKHTGSENYLKCMFQDTWVIDGVTYPR